MAHYKDKGLDKEVDFLKFKLGLKSSVEVLRMAVRNLMKKIKKEEEG